MDIESMRSNPAYAPVGIILGAFAWYAIKILIDHIPCIEAAQLRRTLLALMFSGMLIYMWIQGTNPQDFEVKENTLAYEIPLLLAGGYYLANIWQKSPSRSVHHFFSVLGAGAVIVNKSAAEVANSFGFLVEAPSIFFALRQCVGKLEVEGLTIAVTVLSFLLYLAANFDIGYLNYVIITNDKVAIYLKVALVILSLFTLWNTVEVFLSVLMPPDPCAKKKKGRGRSSSGSSRSSCRSRSRGRRCKR